MSEELHQKNNTPKSINLSEEFPKKEEKKNLIVKLIFVICCSIISFVGINFINCTFMIPGTMERANALGGLKNPPPLDCKESQRRGYETLITLLTTVIALKTKIE